MKILKENKWYLITLVAVTIVFLIIKNTSIYNYVVSFDYSVIESISNNVDKRVTALMQFITNFGDWYTPIAISMCIFIFIKNKLYFYLLTSSYGFSGIISFFTKLIVRRPRPSFALIDIPSSFSFPSGHTLTSIVFYLIFCYLITNKQSNLNKYIYASLFSCLTLIIGFSRIYLGVHFFSDVVGGLIYGNICLLCCINIIEKNFKERL